MAFIVSFLLLFYIPVVCASPSSFPLAWSVAGESVFSELVTGMVVDKCLKVWGDNLRRHRVCIPANASKREIKAKFEAILKALHAIQVRERHFRYIV